MKTRRERFAAAAFIVCTVALCMASGLVASALRRRAPSAPGAAPALFAWPAMGTVAAVVFAPPRDGRPLDGRERDAARETVQNVFSSLERELSAWRADSGLAAVNASAGTGEGVAVPADTVRIYRAAANLAKHTSGAFNPLVGPVMRLYGFNGADGLSLPSPAAIAAVPFAWDGFSVDAAGRVHLRDKGMKLDLGAIAKGGAVDCAFDRVTNAVPGIEAVIDLGGNLRAIGEQAPGSGGWETAIRDPFSKGSEAARFVLRPGEAVATSGSYERFRILDGKRVSHILDGRTGLPCPGFASCTVLAPTALQADGLSTALFILGPEAGGKLLRRIAPSAFAAWIPDDPSRRRIVCGGRTAERLSRVADGWQTVILPGIDAPPDVENKENAP